MKTTEQNPLEETITIELKQWMPAFIVDWLKEGQPLTEEGAKEVLEMLERQQ